MSMKHSDARSDIFEATSGYLKYLKSKNPEILEKDYGFIEIEQEEKPDQLIEDQDIFDGINGFVEM